VIVSSSSADRICNEAAQLDERAAACQGHSNRIFVDSAQDLDEGRTYSRRDSCSPSRWLPVARSQTVGAAAAVAGKKPRPRETIHDRKVGTR
jgi:hypothetical protein